jgi:hypothetical protein
MTLAGTRRSRNVRIEAHRFVSLIGDLRLDDEEVDLAVPTGLAMHVRPEQDHLCIGRDSGQPATRLGDQALVDLSHRWKS